MEHIDQSPETTHQRTRAETPAQEEFERLASLYRTELLGSGPEAAYDTIVRMAQELSSVPMAAISFVDLDRQWFKSEIGLGLTETSREVAFCSHAVQTPNEPFVVEDARNDPRFRDNALVVGDPNVRFYAGFPICDDAGRGLGTLCVIDSQPRVLRDDQIDQLQALSNVAQELVRLRTLSERIDEARSRGMLFESGLNSTGVGLQLIDPLGTVVHTNQAFAEMIGRSPEEIIGRSWLTFADPLATDRFIELSRTSRHGSGSGVPNVSRYLHANGEIVWVAFTSAMVSLDNSDEQIQFIQVTDITPAVREEQETAAHIASQLVLSEQRLQSLIGLTPDPVVLLSANGTIEAMNPAALAVLGDTGASVVGLHVEDVLATYGKGFMVELERAVESGIPSEHEPISFESPDGEHHWYRVRILPVTDASDGTVSVFITGIDITVAVDNERRLEALAHVDPLTGAANRSVLYERLHAARERVRAGDSAGAAVAMIDLDYFKSLNDTYGHDTGDAALIAVVESLNSVVREQDTVARIGGDEFVVLFDDVDESYVSNALAPRLFEQFESIAVPSPSGIVGISGSIGLAWSAERSTGTDLVTAADFALLRAKRDGRNRLWMATDDDAQQLAAENSLRLGLARALEHDEFSLRYQPIVDLSGKSSGYEALLRWEHPLYGTLLPERFMNTLVESGLITSVGSWVLNRAITDAARFARVQPLDVHINLGPSELASTHIAQRVDDLLHQHCVNPNSIVIEITEQALMGTTISNDTVSELASTGVRVALDDFGTGTSSLSHLRHHPLAGLKLDRSFVSGIGQNDYDMAILSGTIGIARELGLDVIAEGVETHGQYRWLVEQGCTHLQGWLMGFPAKFEEVELAKG